MSLTFQRSFKLELDNVAKMLEAVVEMPFASRNEIADSTGIPIGKSEMHGKVDPTICYALYSGLIEIYFVDGVRGRRLTKFGEIVYEHDKKLRLSQTRWGIHQFLSDASSGAPAWSFFTHEFLPSNDTFTRSDLNKGIQSRFSDLSSRYVNENERTILQCYTENSALGRLKIIESFETDTMLRGPVNYPNAYLAAYILAEKWTAKHPDKSMVDPEIMLEPGHLATTLNLNEGDLQNCLREMTSIGAISQMREAPPYQVVRKWTDKYELLRQAYM